MAIWTNGNNKTTIHELFQAIYHYKVLSVFCSHDWVVEYVDLIIRYAINSLYTVWFRNV